MKGMPRDVKERERKIIKKNWKNNKTKAKKETSESGSQAKQLSKFVSRLFSFWIFVVVF